MLLGKRPRPHMKRTTSMKDVAVDLGAATAPPMPSEPEIPGVADGDWKMDRRPDPTTVPPRGPRRSSADYTSAIEAAPFLRACALCNRHLRSGRDIFMYRGEIAFCSSECREQQIKLDEWKEKVKCSASSVKGPAQAKPKANVTTSDASSNGETMAAA